MVGWWWVGGGLVLGWCWVGAGLVLAVSAERERMAAGGGLVVVGASCERGRRGACPAAAVGVHTHLRRVGPLSPYGLVSSVALVEGLLGLDLLGRWARDPDARDREVTRLPPRVVVERAVRHGGARWRHRIGRHRWRWRWRRWLLYVPNQCSVVGRDRLRR